MDKKEILNLVYEKLYTKDNRLNSNILRNLDNYPDIKNLIKIIKDKTSFLQEDNFLRARIYCLENNITSQPVCKFCGKPVKYDKTLNKFRQFCSRECKDKGFHPTEEQRKRHSLLMKGKVSWLKGKNKYNDEKIRKLAEKLSQVKKRKELTEKQKEHLKEMIENNKGKKRKKETLEKMKQTNLEKYGVPNILCKKEIRELGHQKMIEKYGVPYYTQSEQFKKNKDKMIKKMKQTNLKKYGVDIPTKTEFIKEKIFKTKKERNSLNSSKIEIKLLNFLKNYFPDIQYQYKSKKYPFISDYYIPSLDLYIELQAHWTHGGRAFNPQNKKCQQILKEWKEKSKYSKYYKIAIKVWTQTDVLKREYALTHNLNFLEIFEYKDFNNILIQINRVIKGLNYIYSSEEQIKEFINFKNTESSYDKRAYINKIVLSHQPYFFNIENKMYKTNPVIRRKLIENRITYLNKKEFQLSDKEILRGFKISGIYKGYSHFSPFWIKAFIQEYNIQSIYDPFGGWGHRLIGAWDIDYIYNDLNTKIYNGVKNIYKFLNSNFSNNKLKVFYNSCASELTPIEDYECVFTCPPYYKTENYGNDINISYEDWVNIFWRNVIIKSIKKSTKYFVYVISNKYKEDLNKICIEQNLKFLKEIKVNSFINKSHFKTEKEKYESLQIFLTN